MVKTCWIGDLPTETHLMLWLNSHHSAFWDEMMWAITNKSTWLPVVLALIFTLFYRQQNKHINWLFICTVLTIIFADQLSAGLIRPIFECLRPSHHPDYETIVHTVNGYRGGQHGFPSSHAANSFAFTVFLILALRHQLLSAVLLSWAIANSYSRIYLGVHFVIDVIAGTLIGIAIGYGVYRFYQYGRKQWLFERPDQLNSIVLSQDRLDAFTAFFIYYWVLVWFYADIRSMPLSNL